MICDVRPRSRISDLDIFLSRLPNPDPGSRGKIAPDPKKKLVTHEAIDYVSFDYYSYWFKKLLFHTAAVLNIVE